MTCLSPAQRPRALLIAVFVTAGSVLGVAAHAAEPSLQLHSPKQARDDRADPKARLDEVGKGTHFARKPTQPGTYFSDRNREAVHQYYASHPVAGRAVWEIGKPLPRGERVEPVPQPIAGSLPRLPPGHRYGAVGSDILLIATGSGIVVDGIAAAPR